MKYKKIPLNNISLLLNKEKDRYITTDRHIAAAHLQVQQTNRTIFRDKFQIRISVLTVR